MKTKVHVLLAAAALLAAQLACNLPNPATGGSTQIPAPDRTLTALFAITPPGQVNPTPTLPPVITATPAQNPTPTTVGALPTATSAVPAPTATVSVVQPTQPPPPTPTRTAPPPTATIPGVRPRSPVVAKYLNTPPTLDGDWSEWKDITTEYPAATVVYGSSSYTNQDDLAGSFHIGWDTSYLYIAVKVRDDVYVSNDTGAYLYRGDSIEILLDTKLQDDFYYDRLSPDDFQLGIHPGRPDPNGTKEAYLWMPNNIAGKRDGVKIASRLENGIYRVEAAIPWTVFETTPVNGTHMGFALSISDNDNTSANQQQTMVSNVGTRRLTDPTTWGDIHFVR